jgi:hypothetical protein
MPIWAARRFRDAWAPPPFRLSRRRTSAQEREDAIATSRSSSLTVGRSGGFRSLGAVSGRRETSIPSASVRRKIESRVPPPACKPRMRITSLQERPREIAALSWSCVHVRGLPMPGYYGAAYANHPLLCRVYQLPPRAVRCNQGDFTRAGPGGIEPPRTPS